MNQKKISRWLKAIVIVLGLMGIGFFGLRTWYAFYLKSPDISTLSWQSALFSGRTNLLWDTIVFSWYNAILCYIILFQFWKVCTQIGADNSFSLENARAFHSMALCGIAAAVGFALRLCWIGMIGSLRPELFIFIFAEILLSLMFFVLCEALSRLVRNAYEVKNENDLTI